MKLTEDLLDSIIGYFEMDRYNSTTEWGLNGQADKALKLLKQFKQQILSNQEKAEKWDNIAKMGTNETAYRNTLENWSKSISRSEKLEQEIKQLKEELKDYIERKQYFEHAFSEENHKVTILKQKLEKIEKQAFHAGCNGNPKCTLCPIIKILKENK